ncbi:MAG: MFS transporter [Kiritimatiellae bacterium]|nr:MFS transporter [Kiritimatiellia bacterium]
MNNSRRAAAFAVAAWLKTKEFPSNLLPSGPDRSFVQDIVYTVVRRLRPLRKILGSLVKTWPKGELEALLYVGAAQILYMDGVADYAAVNETVEAAKECPNPSVAKVVNGVLRNLLRRRDEFLAALASAPVAEREGYPESLWRRWTARYGAADAEKLAVWHNTPAVTYLARKDGTFTALGRGERVDAVKGFAEGDFIVQDPATALAVGLLAPAEGERILDACAAPGGKTVQIAWRGADVTACEVNPARRRRLAGNLERMKLDVAVVPSLPDAGSFDKVLADAPCTNTGVLRRRPDARWNWSGEKLASLVRLQAEILDRVAPLVRPGGMLVYSTCSNEPEENADQVRAFLSRHPEFSLKDSRESVPFRDGRDGAYAAALLRSASRAD